MSRNVSKQTHLKMVHSDSQQTVQSAQQLSFCFTLFLYMFHPLLMAVHMQFVFDILMKLYVNIHINRNVYTDKFLMILVNEQ